MLLNRRWSTRAGLLRKANKAGRKGSIRQALFLLVFQGKTARTHLPCIEVPVDHTILRVVAITLCNGGVLPSNRLLIDQSLQLSEHLFLVGERTLQQQNLCLCSGQLCRLLDHKLLGNTKLLLEAKDGVSGSRQF